MVAAFSPTASASGLGGYAAYSPWGQVTATGGTMPGTGYQGDYTDPVTGLVHMGARWYDPADGSFVSSDTLNGTPIPSTVDGNPYAYADGNPLTETDPTGHFSIGQLPGDLARVAEPVLKEAEPVLKEAGSVAEEDWPDLFEDTDPAFWVLNVSGDSNQSMLQQQAPVSAPEQLSPAEQMEQWAEDEKQQYERYESELGSNQFNDGIWSASPITNSTTDLSDSPTPCTTGCNNPSSAPLPPPPPPPDCYAGPHPTCQPGPAPGALLHDAWITGIVKDITSIPELCKLGYCINETDKSKQGAVKGTQPSNDNTNAGDLGQADQNTQILLQRIEDQGVQPTPSAGGAGSGGPGDGNGTSADAGQDDSCPASGGESFTPSTRVLLADGKTVPISSLKPGDKVKATDTKTGKTQAETVTAVLVHHDTDLYDLKIRTSGKIAVIDTTSNHLFWVPGTGGHGGRWVKAGSLKYGTHLRTTSGSDTAIVMGGWMPRQRAGWMWDLTVPGNGDHDFYVAVVGTGVLVHNCPMAKPKKLTRLKSSCMAALQAWALFTGGSGQLTDSRPVVGDSQLPYEYREQSPDSGASPSGGDGGGC